MSAATIYVSEPGSVPEPVVCVIPGCGVERDCMVYVWRPGGMSVYEPRCRDHSGGAVMADDRALSPGAHQCGRCELSFGDPLVLRLHEDWAHGGGSDAD